MGGQFLAQRAVCNLAVGRGASQYGNAGIKVHRGQGSEKAGRVFILSIHSLSVRSYLNRFEGAKYQIPRVLCQYLYRVETANPSKD